MDKSLEKILKKITEKVSNMGVNPIQKNTF